MATKQKTTIIPKPKKYENGNKKQNNQTKKVRKFQCGGNVKTKHNIKTKKQNKKTEIRGKIKTKQTNKKTPKKCVKILKVKIRNGGGGGQTKTKQYKTATNVKRRKV